MSSYWKKLIAAQKKTGKGKSLPSEIQIYHWPWPILFTKAYFKEVENSYLVDEGAKKVATSTMKRLRLRFKFPNVQSRCVQSEDLRKTLNL